MEHWRDAYVCVARQNFLGMHPVPPVIAAQKAVKRALCSCYHIK